MQTQTTFSLKREVFKKRTLFSFALSFLFIAIFFSQTFIDDLWRYEQQVRSGFLLLAFICHYASYLFRGLRWQRMLAPTGFTGTAAALTKVTFLFQSVDCILPAKLGDVYGAHLMKLNFGLNRSFAFGSIFLWRLLDLGVVSACATGAAALLFQAHFPAELLLALKVVVPCLLLILLLTGLFVFSQKRLATKIVSAKLNHFLASFREGLRLPWRSLPLLLLLTLLTWGVEVLRLYFACRALGVHLDVVAVTFVTLFSMLFTAIPFTPAGLGAVELAMLHLLQFVGIAGPVVYPIILWDRLISHWSQILFGALVVLISKPINLKIWHTAEDLTLSTVRDGAPS